MDDRCSVRAFGGFEVRIGGERVDVRGGLSSAILARLALAAGAPVPTDALVAALWDEPPANAAGSLRVYVSRMRSGPLGAVLEGGRGGYALAVARDDVDVLRHRDLVAAAVGAEHPDLLRRGHLLDPWPGDPFEGLTAYPFARRARAELLDERHALLERLAPALVDAGEADRAIAALRPAVADEPTREALVLALARAQATAGSTHAALATIDALRDRLRDEQGLDASPAVLAMRQAILRRDAAVVPAAAATTVRRHHVPVPLTRLIGREVDLERIEEARLAHRLVSLVGPGGAGKTRLAVESARRSTRTIDAEQWMVDWSTLAAGGDVLGATADALGAAEHSIAGIAARLEGRPTLLVLDNAEHVLDSARALVSQLLSSCAGLAVLVTSREPLGIAGELVLRVGGLVGAAGEEAVQLFLERSTAARGGTAPAASDADVRRLCRLLDGLPLALELAAARTDVLGVAELTAALDRGERLPGASLAADRHASLERTIRWSTDTLPADELALLVELSGFAGPVTLDAIEHVCTPTDRPVRDVALALARRSLVAVDETEDGRRRYRLLESTKAHVRPMRSADDAAAWRLRHRTYLASLVDELAPTIRTHAAGEAHALFDALAPDLQAAIDAAVEAGDRDMALRLAGGLAWHWFKRGWLVEGRAVIDRARAIPGEGDAAIEARALVGIVNLAYQSGDAEAAFEYVRLGIERATEGGERLALASLLAYVAYGRSLFGDPAEAEGLIAQALVLAEDAPDWLRAELLMSKGQTLRALGQPAQALESLEEARRLAKGAGHAWALTSSQYVAGKILVDVRRAREAIALLVGGARTAAAGGDFPGALALLHLVGGATAFVERHATGATIFGAVDAIGRRYSYNPVAAEGADASIHRDRVAAGLASHEHEAAYEAGARLGLPELLALGASLARAR